MSNAQQRSALIATIQLKGYGMSARFGEEMRKGWEAAAPDLAGSGISLDIFAIHIGNPYKVVDVWGGPSIEAIQQSLEVPGWQKHDFPFDELMAAEVIEAATRIFSSKTTSSNQQPASLIAEIQLKGYGMSARFGELMSELWAAAAPDLAGSEISLETYAINPLGGNPYKVVNLWSGPSLEAIEQAFEVPGMQNFDFPFDEFMAGENLEAATRIFSSEE